MLPLRHALQLHRRLWCQWGQRGRRPQASWRRRPLHRAAVEKAEPSAGAGRASDPQRLLWLLTGWVPVWLKASVRHRRRHRRRSRRPLEPPSRPRPRPRKEAMVDRLHGALDAVLQWHGEGRRGIYACMGRPRRRRGVVDGRIRIVRQCGHGLEALLGGYRVCPRFPLPLLSVALSNAVEASPAKHHDKEKAEQPDAGCGILGRGLGGPADGRRWCSCWRRQRRRRGDGDARVGGNFSR